MRSKVGLEGFRIVSVGLVAQRKILFPPKKLSPKLEIVHGKCYRKSISYEGSCKSKDDVKLCAPAPFSLNNCDGKVNASLMEFRIFL